MTRENGASGAPLARDEAELIGYFRRMDAERRGLLMFSAEAFARVSEKLADGIEAIRALEPSDFEEAI